MTPPTFDPARARDWPKILHRRADNYDMLSIHEQRKVADQLDGALALIEELATALAQTSRDRHAWNSQGNIKVMWEQCEACAADRALIARARGEQ